MTSKDEALKLALEALLINCGGNTEGIGKEAIATCEQALAAPVQEPVGSLNITSYKGLGNYDFDYVGQLPDGTYSVYTTPPAAAKEKNT